MARLLVVTTVPATLRGFLLPIARHFRSLGWEVDAMAHDVSHDRECSDAFNRVWDVQLSRNPLELKNLTRAPGVIRDTVLRNGGYDLVHVHTPIAAFATRLALRNLRRFGKPRVIYTAHGFHFHQGGSRLGNFLFLSLEKIAGRWTDYLVVMNGEDREATRRFGLVDPDRVCFMPGAGIDSRKFDPATVNSEQIAGVRQEMGLKEGDRILLMVAEFNPGKRHQDAIAALAALGRPEVHLAFAGDGPQLKAIRAMATELGLSQNVHFLGFRRDIPVLMLASDALLLPSEREGLPLSVMEAHSLGVPVIGADVRGTRDLLAHGTGIIHSVGDVQALARAMEQILQDPAEATSLGQRGKERSARYDLEHILALHEQLYAAALEGNGLASLSQLSAEGNLWSKM